MDGGPLDDESEDSRRQIAVQKSQVFDSNNRPLTAITYVKVGRGMIIVKHRDNNSEETADLGHDYRRLVLITIGVPSNPNFSLSRLIKYRSAEK